MERLQKIIALSGYTSRRKAEELIKNWKVEVNGKIITDLGTKANFSDDIVVNGEAIKYEEKEYILLYKPRGIITTTNDEKGRKTVLDLVKTNKRLYPVGRLDYDTSGLLILTNDGELTNLLTHPKNQIDKVYTAKVSVVVNKSELAVICRGVIIDGVKTSKAKARIRKINKKLDYSIVELTIHEGKNHQVKKMFDIINPPVIKLKRDRVSFLDLNGLKSGEYRKLTIKEVKKLYNECK